MRGGVLALGNFDGVHRGHRAVIDAGVAQARALGTAVRVLTFEPHPRAFFQPSQPPFRLTPLAVKERLLRSCGVDEIETAAFNAEFARIPAQAFVDRVLCEQLGALHVVAGHDFVFGHQRGGDMAKLAAWLQRDGIGVTEVPALGNDGEVYSSTRVRELLRLGEVAEAADILGRPWSIEGVVINGAKRGRSIGVPTANMTLGEYLRPRFGVYAIRAGRVGEALSYKGVANIGQRPTVDGKSETLEAHLFDFNRDIYGEAWEIALTRFIRPERKFDSLDELKAQITQDIAQAAQA